MTQQPGAATAQQQPLVDLGTALVHAWTHRTGWIYRRTERYEFSHEDTLRCEIQLELTIRPAMPRILPASGPEVCMVPLMLVKKGATPLDICVRDGSGNFLRHLDGKDVQDVHKEVLRAAAAF